MKKTRSPNKRAKRQTYSNPRVHALVEHFGRRSTEDPRTVLSRLVGEALRAAGALDREPPVDQAPLFEHFRILGVREQRILGTALLGEEGDDFVIYVNKGVTGSRMRFAIFHEMAHIFFIRAAREVAPFMTTAELGLCRRFAHEEERLCDFAAGAFLIPSELVSIKDTIPVAWPAVQRIARTFETSVEAAVRRLIELSDGPILFGRASTTSFAGTVAVDELVGALRRRPPADRLKLFGPEYLQPNAGFVWNYAGEPTRFTVRLLQIGGNSPDTLMLAAPADQTFGVKRRLSGA